MVFRPDASSHPQKERKAEFLVRPHQNSEERLAPGRLRAEVRCVCVCVCMRLDVAGVGRGMGGVQAKRAFLFIALPRPQLNNLHGKGH